MYFIDFRFSNEVSSSLYECAVLDLYAKENTDLLMFIYSPFCDLEYDSHDNLHHSLVVSICYNSESTNTVDVERKKMHLEFFQSEFARDVVLEGIENKALQEIT